MTKQRTLTVKHRTKGTVARVIDVTGKSEDEIDRIVGGILINSDSDNWGVYDSKWDEEGQ